MMKDTAKTESSVTTKAMRKQQKLAAKQEKAQAKLKEKLEKQRKKAQKKLERAEHRWQLAAFKQDIKEIFRRRKQQGRG